MIAKINNNIETIYECSPCEKYFGWICLVRLRPIKSYEPELLFKQISHKYWFVKRTLSGSVFPEYYFRHKINFCLMTFIG